jgi:steroid 5-alpha reductase family enzyme
MVELNMALEIFYALIISFLIQLVFFIVAVSFKTDKVTDLSYGLGFITVAIFYLSKSIMGPSQMLVTLLIIVWGFRITFYLFKRILKMKTDPRFDQIRNNYFKFASFWILQAVSIWLIMLPSLVILLSNKSYTPTFFTFIGMSIWLGGFLIEYFSDKQKFEFKNNPKNKDKWITSGLWKYSRHPNYFGEMLCWWGIFIFSLPFLTGWSILAIISPLYISYLLLFVTGIPPLEKRYDQKYANNKEYQVYKRRTSILIPFLL